MLTLDALRSSGLLSSMSRTQSGLATAALRISTGQRINRASDDPAGLVMANTMRAEIGGLSAQIANAGRLNSMVDAASAGVNSQLQNLQDMRSLAVQAANGTTTNSERASLQEQVSALASSFDTAAQHTSFGGQNLLDGSIGEKSFSLGASGSAGVDIDFGSTRASHIGQVAEVLGTATTTAALADGDLVINGVSIGAAQSADDLVSTSDKGASAIATAAAINRADTGVQASALATTVNLGAVSSGTFSAGDLTINGVDIGAVTVAAGDGDSALQDAINAVSSSTGVTASMESGQLVLTAEDGRNIVTDGNNTSGAGVVATDPGSQTYTGGVALTSSSDIAVSGAAPASAGLTAATTAVNTTQNVSTIDVSTEASAEAAIRQIDAAIEELSAVQTAFGAAGNQVEAAQSTLTSSLNVLSGGLSNIVNADIASETARLSAQSFLFETQIALLAQFNTSGQWMLDLLKVG